MGQPLGHDEADSLEELAGEISHDVNNLLGTALGRCELMELRLDADHPMRQDIQTIKEGIDKAATLIQQLRRALNPTRR